LSENAAHNDLFAVDREACCDGKNNKRRIASKYNSPKREQETRQTKLVEVLEEVLVLFAGDYQGLVVKCLRAGVEQLANKT
jgi:hypothetical protein